MTSELRLSDFQRFLHAIPPRDRLVFACVGAAVVLALLTWCGERYLYQPWLFSQRAAQAKQNLHAIQLALERFAVDSDGNYYPGTCGGVIEQGYIPQYPDNPFAGRPMRELGPAESPSLGDFYYLPQWSAYRPPDSEPQSEPTGYELQLCLSAEE